MHRTLDSNVNEAKTELLILLAVSDKIRQIRSDFGLNVFHR